MDLKRVFYTANITGLTNKLLCERYFSRGVSVNCVCPSCGIVGCILTKYAFVRKCIDYAFYCVSCASFIFKSDLFDRNAYNLS